MHLNFIQVVFTLILLHCCATDAFFDPVSIGVGIGAYGYNLLKDQAYCRMVECCNTKNIPADIKELENKLKYNLFGQHIVVQQLIPALEAHLSHSSKSKKPLVISFHGTPGTGKNFVADMVAQTMFKAGLNSKFVHKYLGRADFPLASEADIYKERINREVRTGIAECPRSLFIFDEVDKMPPGVFESLTSLVDYNALHEGKDYTKAIFLFLSNTAGVQISDRLGKLIKNGKLREESKLSDYEQILEMAAYNLDGGMQKTSLIEAHVIDHYLPFLPLEKSHVIKCLEAEYRRWGEVPNIDAISNIAKNGVSYDRNFGFFATSGCKTLEKKIAVEIVRTKKKKLEGH